MEGIIGLFDSNLVEGIFLNECKNRFLCLVLIGGEVCECYIPSSSRLENYINLINKKVLLSKNKGKSTRTKYSVFAVCYRNKYILLNLNLVNRLFEDSVLKGQYEEYKDINSIVREINFEGYKVDLLFNGIEKTIVENKGILCTTKQAIFPTVYSERAVSQLKKLELLLNNGYRVHYNFISLSPFVKSIRLNKAQTEYYEYFIKCVNKNMKVSGYSFCYENANITNKRIKIDIDE